MPTETPQTSVTSQQRELIHAYPSPPYPTTVGSAYVAFTRDPCALI
nr:MAG TPA: hypothetical protein [Caudoviricetes sp.]